MRKTLILSILILMSSAYFSQSSEDFRNHKFKTFTSAKKEVYKIAVTKKTFYCGCPFNSKKEIDLGKCGYKFRKDEKRARRVEIEHVVPAEKLCGKTQEWLVGNSQCVNHKGKPFKGRKCASEFNDSCNMAHNDLHNLRPAVGEINNDRSDYPFADLTGNTSTYGTCQFKIQNHKVDPPANIHGDIARIYLHMNKAYPELKILNKDEIDFFKKWSEADPVSPEECEYENKIFRTQGVHNQFVYRNCINH